MTIHNPVNTALSAFSRRSAEPERQEDLARCSMRPGSAALGIGQNTRLEARAMADAPTEDIKKTPLCGTFYIAEAMIEPGPQTLTQHARGSTVSDGGEP